MSMGVLALVILCGIGLIAILGWGIFLLLVQLGVIVQKASEPPYTDMGGYSLEQGRDVGREEPSDKR